MKDKIYKAIIAFFVALSVILTIALSRVSTKMVESNTDSKEAIQKLKDSIVLADFYTLQNELNTKDSIHSIELDRLRASKEKTKTIYKDRITDTTNPCSEDLEACNDYAMSQDTLIDSLEVSLMIKGGQLEVKEKVNCFLTDKLNNEELRSENMRAKLVYFCNDYLNLKWYSFKGKSDLRKECLNTLTK